MKKILITGSNGLLGQKLVQLILQKNEFELVATSRGENRIASIFPEMRYLQMDTCNSTEVLNTIDKVRPDFVIHTAAMTQVDDCENDPGECDRQNVKAVQYLIEACTTSKAHLVHLSTDFIFDGENGPYDENAEANPVSIYGASKLKSEELIKNSTLKYAIVRTVLVYGIVHAMSRSNIILWVKNSLENGKEIKVVNDQWRSPTLAEDLAIGCYLICKKAATGVFNISGPDFINPYQMALATAEYFKLDPNLIKEVDGSIFSQAAKRPPKTGFILNKAKQILGYEPRSFDEGISILASQIAAQN